MPPILKSFETAEKACLIFVANALGMKPQVDAGGPAGDIVRDDWLMPDLVNAAAFSLSGGPEQTQNFGNAPPSGAWLTGAGLIVQRETRAAAVEDMGRIQAAFPARRASNAPGLPPNVHNFEILNHPTIESRVILDKAGYIASRIFIFRAGFRVVYSNVKD